ncbi:forkhead box protein P3a isoform X2 [Denticeps clupeoides]|uniref:Fork-head domain-containing protein n=1 Tax=Denticeps clupeoides TaxID=299321 RepID=A0AAY4D5U4_9TELE|nr:forkhead box protein P1-like isoform X2 [Denticeps clupeoides]XP_028849768.1 forkhead box protein P1-like isoform X2 [Denticeps clupeoides]
MQTGRCTEYTHRSAGGAHRPGMPQVDGKPGRGHDGEQKPQHQITQGSKLSRVHSEDQGHSSFDDGSRGSTMAPASFLPQGTSPRVADKLPLHMKQHRPSVLRKGHKSFPHVLSSQGGPSSSVFKTEPRRASSPESETTSLRSDILSSRPAVHSPHNSVDPEQSPRISPLQSTSENSLFIKGLCRWPGCSQAFKDFQLFYKHLCANHSPGEKSLAQLRVQGDAVQHMEKQLALERQRLLDMQLHLHQFDLGPSAEDPQRSVSGSATLLQNRSANGGLQGAIEGATDAMAQGYWQIPTSPFIPGIMPSIEYYKYTNIRPPYTYAAMIRRAILESSEKQLTLNEIYQWFTRMFFFFRHNTATWKNAVRHNLSLHKCFVRVEGGKGSVWTVDEAEFLRRKGQKFHRDHDANWFSPYAFALICPQRSSAEGQTHYA